MNVINLWYSLNSLGLNITKVSRPVPFAQRVKTLWWKGESGSLICQYSFIYLFCKWIYICFNLICDENTFYILNFSIWTYELRINNYRCNQLFPNISLCHQVEVVIFTRNYCVTDTACDMFKINFTFFAVLNKFSVIIFNAKFQNAAM